MQNRHDLRRLIRQRRRSVCASSRAQYGQQLAQHIAQVSFFKKSHRLALYVAHNDEIDTQSIMNIAFKEQKAVHLPVIDKNIPQQMQFARYSHGDVLAKNRYGILEPRALQIISAKELDVVFLPLVAFDKKGNRLGMGGGFYDFTFSFKKNQSKPLMVGLAYEIQEVETIESEKWDIPLDYVVTEKGIKAFNPDGCITHSKR